MDNPRSPPARDPFVIGFLALLAIGMVAGLALAIHAYVSYVPSAAPASSKEGGLSQFSAALKQAARDMHDKIRSQMARTDANAPGGSSPPAKDSRPLAAPAAPPSSTATIAPFEVPAPPPPHARPVPANGAWTYFVLFGDNPNPVGQLSYRTRHAVGNAPPESDMTWQPNGGQGQTWSFGTVAAHHPSHANTRFPGFFMHAAYLPETLASGQILSWEFPWQGGNAALPPADRVRRFDFKVAGWEKLKTPAGQFDAARLEGRLRYLEKEAVRAEVEYTLWYAPAARQTVRVRWVGRSPDEGSTNMTAELAAMRLP